MRRGGGSNVMDLSHRKHMIQTSAGRTILLTGLWFILIQYPWDRSHFQLIMYMLHHSIFYQMMNRLYVDQSRIHTCRTTLRKNMVNDLILQSRKRQETALKPGKIHVMCSP